MRISQDKFIRIEKYLDLKRKEFLEVKFIDEELFNYAIEFYNEYFDYKEHPLTRNEALMYAELGVRINADLWKSLMPMDRIKLDFFYKITPFYFFHDILRMMDGMHREMMEQFLHQVKETFLDFAGGTGGFSIFLAKHGKRVTFFDTNTMQLAWMNWINKKLNLNITILSSIEEITGKFSVVNAKDIAEHVIDPGKLYDFLLSFLEEGGRIHFTTVPCCGADELAPMHFKVEQSEDNGFIYNAEENIASLAGNPLQKQE